MKRIFLPLLFLLSLSLVDAYSQTRINGAVIEGIKINLFEPEYESILSYARTQGYTVPSAAQQIKQNRFIFQLKTNGFWTLIDVMYVFATDGNSDFATINWKDPYSYQATKINSPTFTTDIGFTGNGSTSYLTTGFAPSNGTNYAQSDASLIVATNSTSTAGRVETGVNAGASTQRSAIAINNSALANHAGIINRSGGAHTFADSGFTGFNHLQLTGGTTLKYFRAGVQRGSVATTSTTRTSNQFYISAENGNGTPANYSTAQISLVMYAASLSGSELSLFNIWATYILSL